MILMKSESDILPLEPIPNSYFSKFNSNIKMTKIEIRELEVTLVPLKIYNSS
jgi:hypothetical protein